ncbi:MAG: hypothetical protein EOO30_04525 [Comamonadaceae bacterium]|nr:MAG: hypothetical protein EOO30_04525 [Comamonadaceae bacterium]
MQAIRRSLAAATLLLAPAALLVSQPAAAQDQRWEQHQRDHQDDRGDRDHRDLRWRRDVHAPQIIDVTPDRRVGDRGRTRIGVRFHDQGSGVAGVRLRVDGRDVTHAARVDHDEVRYRDDLAPGRHHAEVVVRDRAGNVARHAWSFVVVDRDRNYGYYGQPPYQRW